MFEFNSNTPFLCFDRFDLRQSIFVENHEMNQQKRPDSDEYQQKRQSNNKFFIHNGCKKTENGEKLPQIFNFVRRSILRLFRAGFL